jgi:tetratricopeptide (TPR) repeat protein
VTSFDKNKKKPVLFALSLLMLAACSTPEETAQNHIQTGKAYMEQGDLDKALLEFKTANQDGKHAQAYYYMALLDEKHNNPAAMRENLHSCLQLDDGMVDAKVKLAQVELNFGNLAEAAKQIDGVMISHPDNIEAQLVKASILLRQNHNQDAATLLDSILNSNPDNVEALSIKTEYFIRQGDLDQALATSNNALKIDPNYKPLHQLRINIFSRKNNIDAITPELIELSRLEPDNDSYKLRLASIDASNNNLPEAETILRNMVSQKPNRVENKLILLQFLESHDQEKVVAEYDQWLNNTNNNLLLPPETKTQQVIEISRWLIAHDHYDAAENGLKQVIDTEKDLQLNLKTQITLAELSFEKKQYAEAEAAADHILKQNSDFIQASFLKARINLVQNKTDEALKILNGLVWAKDKSGDLYTYLGMAYLQKNDPIQADKNFKQALELDPTNRAAFFPVYQSYLKNNQKENAKQVLDKALKYKPNLDWLLITKAEMDIQEKDWDSAKNTVRLLAMFSKNRAATAYLLANIQQGTEQFDKAIALYQQVLTIAPDYTDAFINLIRCYEGLKARDKGLAYLEAFHAQHPESIKVVLLLGELYSANKETAKIKKLFTEQLQHTPKATVLYLDLAKLAVFEKAKPEEVKDILEQGLKNVPDDLNLSIALAGWYEDTADYEKARNLYQTLWEKHPESDIVTNNLANILLNSAAANDVNRGQILAQRFKTANRPDFLDTYGWSLVKAGQTAKAIEILKPLIEKNHDLPEVKYHLGVAYLNDGKKNQAVTELKQALAQSDKLNRDFFSKNNALKLLQELEPAAGKK